MLADIAAQFGEVKQTFDEASEVLGYDLWQLVQNGPAEELDKTIHTQPALLAASLCDLAHNPDLETHIQPDCLLDIV